VALQLDYIGVTAVSQYCYSRYLDEEGGEAGDGGVTHALDAPLTDAGELMYPNAQEIHGLSVTMRVLGCYSVCVLGFYSVFISV
jgi:hypothetical protein